MLCSPAIKFIPPLVPETHCAKSPFAWRAMACNSSRAATAPFCADPVDHSRASPIRAVSKLDSYLLHRPTHRLHPTVPSIRRLTAALSHSPTEARQWTKPPPASRTCPYSSSTPLVSSDPQHP